MNPTRYVRLAAFFSVVLLLVVSITPVLAQSLVEFGFVLPPPPPPQSTGITGASVIFTHGDASGHFVIWERSPDRVRPPRILLLTPQEGNLTCIREVPHVSIRGIAHQGRFGNDRLLGEYTMTVTPLSTATNTNPQTMNVFIEIRLEDRVIEFENVRIRVVTPNPC